MNFSEYSSEVFNKIASLNKANGALHEKGGSDTIDNVLRPLFFNHNLADLFGVGLVHRHSNIESGKAMVECNNVSGPWELGSLSKHGGSIVPLSWTMVEGTIYPYEYVFTNHNQTVPVSVEDCSAFAQAFFEAVQKLGLEQVIGLRRRPANEGLEVTEGAMNIMFPINEVSCPAEKVEGIKHLQEYY